MASTWKRRRCPPARPYSRLVRPYLRGQAARSQHGSRRWDLCAQRAKDTAPGALSTRSQGTRETCDRPPLAYIPGAMVVTPDHQFVPHVANRCLVPGKSSRQIRQAATRRTASPSYDRTFRSVPSMPLTFGTQRPGRNRPHRCDGGVVGPASTGHRPNGGGGTLPPKMDTDGNDQDCDHYS